MERTKSDISCCGYSNEYSDDMHIKSKHDDLPSPYVIDGRENCLLSIGGQEHSSLGFMWNKVFKSEVIRDVRFRKDIVICDDLFFTYETMNNSNRICILDLPMYHYRYVAASLSKSKNITKYCKCLNGLEVLNSWVKDNAPSCLNNTITNYIFWNTKACESMLSGVDSNLYKQCKKNIEENKEYIKKCDLRVRILANSIRKSWALYVIWGYFFWCMKKLYILIKRL